MSEADASLQVLRGLTGIIQQNNTVAEAALAEILAVAQQYSSNIPALLALATAFVRVRQIPKARSQLKRIQVRLHLATQWVVQSNPAPGKHTSSTKPGPAYAEAACRPRRRGGC